MSLYCIGINHKSTSVELREQATVSYETLQDRFNAAGLADGVAMISTCNRIELYFSADEHTQPVDLISFWQTNCDQPVNLTDAVEVHTDDAAAYHLFRVSAGLESMVLGEPQILGQVTRAYESAISYKTADPLIKSVFKHAIRSGKRARTETAISKNPVSVSTIGVSLINRHVPDRKNGKILVLGAGEMAQLAVKGLQQFGLTDITIVNRSFKKAEALAKRWGIQAGKLTDLCELLPQADGVISATAAPGHVITTDHLENVARPLVMIDLAVPRDIAPSCGDSVHVKLFDVDDLKNVLAEGMVERQKMIPAVETILAEELSRYQTWLKELTVHPTLTALRRQAEDIRQKELARTLKYLGDIDPSMLKHIDKLSQTIVKQLLHRPTVTLRDEARNGTLNGLDESTKKLFDL